MVDTFSMEYISVKIKVLFQTIMIFLPVFLYSCLVVCLISLGIMFSFDFIWHTGLGMLQFFECIALYFMSMELSPTIKKLIIFK